MLVNGRTAIDGRLGSDSAGSAGSAIAGGRVRGGLPFLHIADEAETALIDRTDRRLVIAAVAKGAPRRLDAGAERRIRDDPPLPNGGDQLVLAHHPVAMLDEVNQQVEDLRLDPNGVASAKQLAARHVDFKLTKAEVQVSLFFSGGSVVAGNSVDPTVNTLLSILSCHLGNISITRNSELPHRRLHRGRGLPEQDRALL